MHPALSPDSIAVITGAASGIGLAMARKFRSLGLRVCMLDQDGERLGAAASAMAPDPHAADQGLLARVADVSNADDLAAARDAVMDLWDRPPSVLVNNAATRTGGGSGAPIEDWRAAFEVNLWGVVNGVRTFAPAMIEAATPGLIVNLGSKQGITNPPGNTAYNMTKAALRTYTEALEHELRGTPGRKVTAHLLVPGWTTTGGRQHQSGAWMPDQVVEYMLAALGRGSFYIVCPDDDVSAAMDRARILWTASDITEDRPPLSRWLAEYGPEFERFSRSL